MTKAPTLAADAKVMSLIVDGRRRVNTSFPDGSEMMEEFDIKTNELLLRKTRRKTTLGGEGEWVIEVGSVALTSKPFDPSKDAIALSSSAPIFCRLDTKDSFQWRIRNLPFAAEVFAVTVEGPEIVVRTSNKKYFKRIDVPDMRRLSLSLESSQLSWKLQHNTLVISYKKPQQIIDHELQHLQTAIKSSVNLS
jgi:hypothetical protein